MKFIQNNWKKLTGILVVIAVLVFAYWYGGNAPGTKGFLVEEKSDSSTEQSAEEATGALDETSGEEAASKPDSDEGLKQDTSAYADNSANDGSSGVYKQGAVDASDNDGSYDSNAFTDYNDDDEPYTDGNGAADTSEDSEKSDENASDGNNAGGNKPDNPSDDGKGGNGKTDGNSGNEGGDSTENHNTGGNGSGNGGAGGNTDSSGGQKNPSDSSGGNTTEAEKDNPASYQKCTISIACNTILNNMPMLDKSKKSIVPADGWILKTVTVEFTTGETVFEVLERVTKKYGIQLEYSYTPMYGSYYIEGIYNLYEFDCGNLSGWMYSVNGSFPNFGCSRYVLKDGDVIEWVYTCDLGADVGNPY